MSLGSALPLALSLAGPAGAQPPPPPPPGQAILESIQIPGQGAAGRWDFMVVDPAAHRLYISDSTNQTLDVVDTNTTKVLAQIPGLPVKLDNTGAFANGANGFQAAPDLGKGFASDDLDNSLHVYDLNALKETAVVKMPGDIAGSDSVAYDPADKKVYVSNGDAKAIVAFDATSNKPLKTINLPGSPEIAIYDQADGMIHQNLSDTNQQVVIDPKTDAIKATFNLPAGCTPHGLAADPTTNHIIIGCSNAKQPLTVIIDGNNGSVLMQSDKTGGSDVADYDPINKRFYVAGANNPGGPVMGIYDAAPPFNFIANAKTGKGAHSLAVDPSSGIIFVGAGGLGQVMFFPPAPERLSYPALPGTRTEETPAFTPMPDGHVAFGGDIVEVDQSAHMMYLGVRDDAEATSGGLAVYDVSGPQAQPVAFLNMGAAVNGVMTAPDLQKVALGMGGSQVAIVDVNPSSPTYLQVLNTINTGGQLRADEGDYDPVDHKLYIANSDDNRVTVVDMVSNQMLTQFLNLGDGLEQPRYNPVDGMMYMTGSDENVLYKFDPTTDTLVDKIDVGDNCHAHGIGINPTTNQALLGCSVTVNQHVALWDFAQNKVVATSDMAGGTDAVIYNAAADRYFTGSGRYFRGGGIGVFGGDGSFITMVGTTDGNAHQVAYDQTNRMLYTTMAASPTSIQLAGFPLPG